MATGPVQKRQVSKTYGLESGTIKGELRSYVVDVLPEDMKKVLVQIVYEEINAQIDIGNPPSNILVDGRSAGNRGVERAQRRVVVNFADTARVIEAIKEAYGILQRVTRIESPAKNNIVARYRYYLWINGKNAGVLPNAFARLASTTIEPTTVLRVVGPLVPYGRKIWWSPIGSSRKRGLLIKERTTYSSGRVRMSYFDKYSPRFKPFRERTLRRMANQLPKGDQRAKMLARLQKQNPGYAEGVGRIVRRIMRANRYWSGLYISDGWVHFPPAKSWGKTSRDDRVPSVSVQMARKGATKLVRL